MGTQVGKYFIHPKGNSVPLTKQPKAPGSLSSTSSSSLSGLEESHFQNKVLISLYIFLKKKKNVNMDFFSYPLYIYMSWRPLTGLPDWPECEVLTNAAYSVNLFISHLQQQIAFGKVQRVQNDERRKTRNAP